MIHTSKQLKDLVRNMTRSTGVEAHVLLRKYMMERLLERVSLSPYKSGFILKGGLLVSSIVGVDIRATMDMDTTIKGLPLTPEDIERIINEIVCVPLEDGVDFQIKNISPIMDEAEYSGLRVSMEASLDKARIPMKVDVSTGDVITPAEIQYDYKLMFEDRSIPILAYPLETVLSEKIESVISRSTTNTRMRDFYDIHILLQTQRDDIDPQILKSAVRATAEHRRTGDVLNHAEAVVSLISTSAELKLLWKNYQKKYPYAQGYSWDTVVASAKSLCSMADILGGAG